jgi:transposase
MRCQDTAPYRSKIKKNLIGWMALDGSGVVTSCTHTVKGWVFRGFVREHLVPHLRTGDVVIWYNARIHGVEEVQQMIEAKGASVLPLPPYSPDLSPIEPGWAKIKMPVKRLRPETWEQLSEAITLGVESVEASDVAGWFNMCGYFNQRE